MNHRGVAKLEQTELPGWYRTMQAKHEQLIANHERRFGKLGQHQTKKQKLSLQNALKQEQS
jgi:arsenate reductase-like glutaredoxin family protein